MALDFTDPLFLGVAVGTLISLLAMVLIGATTYSCNRILNEQVRRMR